MSRYPVIESFPLPEENRMRKREGLERGSIPFGYFISSPTSREISKHESAEFDSRACVQDSRIETASPVPSP